MSGHSKWSKVKHQKATTDAVKSSAFTKASRAVTVSVLEGGGVTDPNKNFKLRLAIEKAKSVNMPKENIERAIERAVSADAASLEQIVYEGYAAGGVAILIEAATDNHQRTSANIKHVLDRAGGSIASPGSVSYQFVRCGVVTVEKQQKPFDAMLEIAIAAGATDVEEADDLFEVYTKPSDITDVLSVLTKAGWVVENWEVIMKPTVPLAVDDAARQAIDGLVETLEELDDVQKVYSSMA